MIGVKSYHRLKLLRDDVFHLEVQEMSETLEVSEEEYLRMESGEDPISLSVSEKLCYQYKINLNFLLCGEGSMVHFAGRENKLGYRVFRVQQALGYNEPEFAEVLEIGLSELIDIQTGDYALCVKEMQKISEAFHVDEHWLKSGTSFLFSPVSPVS